MLRAARVLAAAVLVAAVVGSGSVHSAPGSATVIGHVGIGELEQLEVIDFFSTGQRANDLTFTVGDQRPEVLMCEGPSGLVTGRCTVHTTAARYVLTDLSRDLVNAEGACRLVIRGVAECHAPDGLYHRSSYWDVFVNVELGEGNDAFKSVISTGHVSQKEIYVFNVDGGPGDDRIVLLDTTETNPDNDLYDQVRCGSGIDTAIVGPLVIVDADCESVTRIVG